MKSRIASRFTLSSLIVILIAGCKENPPATTTTESSTPAPASAPASLPASEAAIPGPVAGTRLTEAYVAQVGRTAYFWAWPMVNVYNRVLVLDRLPGPALMNGIVPVAPPNQLTMLTNYVAPQQRMVACPNQDVVYGFGPLALDRDAVVVQVPDFGDRFWVYQVVDQRTDSFAHLGKMYGSKPGAYLLVGPDWKGKVPDGIAGVFHSPTNYGIVIPRVFKSATPEDTKAIRPLINQIAMYPLAQFDGTLKTRDWSTTPKVFSPSGDSKDETQWVDPTKFVAQLPSVLDRLPPLPGEEGMYATFRAVLAAADQNRLLKRVLQQAVLDADKELVQPLFQFRSYGIPLHANWTTQNNGASFGTDYYTRTAVAKSNIFVNAPNETKYFYQDLDSTGSRLNGAHRYTVTFAKDALPPVKGFWSLTVYNEHHFFEPNNLARYSLGTKNKDLQFDPDGSLTIYVSANPPGQDKMTNWLPVPIGDFSLYIRSYWPEAPILEGKWTPPPVVKVVKVM